MPAIWLEIPAAFRVASLVAAPLLASAWAPIPSLAPPFGIGVADSANDVGRYASFAIDSRGDDRLAIASNDREASLHAGIDDDWWSAVEKDIARLEYHIAWQGRAAPAGVGSEAGGAYHAPNRAQNFRTYFTEEGIRVIPRTAHRGEAPAWEWGLSLTGWGREGAPLLPAAAPQLRVEGDRIEYERGDLMEWYVNDARGLEQGFTIARRPGAGARSGLRGEREFGGERLRLELAVSGTVTATVAADGQTVDFLAPGGARAIRFDHLYVADARGRALRSRFECGFGGIGATPGPQALAVVVDDRDAEYPITIDPLATSPDWTAESDQAGAFFGYSVGTAGDVNGDGFSDVIVGAHSFDNGQTNEGRAFVYHGSVSGLSLAPNWTAECDQASAFFGISVGTAGDVNGDGFSDVIVGAYSFYNGESQEGRAFVYHGSASGLSLTADWTAESDQAFASLGYSVGTAGDVNGDGFSDVIVGAHSFDNGQTNEGRAFVYHGSASGLSLAANWTAESDQANAEFGVSVGMAGDVNGDGFSDVIVGAHLFYNGQTNEGRAFVYHGSASGLSLAANWRAESDQADGRLGVSVATAGDVNGDGFSDVIVGTAWGRAFVYHGSASGLSLANWTVESDQAGAGFGYSVGTAGDMNGDGFSDVIVGAFQFGETYEGRAFVYHGSASGLSLAANWTAESDQAFAYLGYSVGTAGDVNGDGFSDVIVGAYEFDNGQENEGRAFVYHGSASGLAPYAYWAAESDQAGAFFGYSVGTAGDVNGDGFSDVIVGAYSFDNGEADEGRAFVYHGSASGLNLIAAWTAESDQAGAFFGYSVGTAGDVNGDGFSDVIVGAYQFDNGQSDEGRAFVYHGSTTGLSSTADWTAESDQAGAFFGYSVGTAGDVTGDGLSDVIVGAYQFDSGQSNEGRAFVYHGSASGPSLTADWTAESDQAGASFGYSVGTAGDVNGDGFSDVIVGAYQYDNGQSNEGRAFVYHGSTSGPSLTADWTAESDQADAFFGISVGTAGDVNGDGFSDAIVGAPLFDIGQTNEGRAFVYHGSASGLSVPVDWTAESVQANALFGISVGTAGDVSGDGFSDVIVGAPLFDSDETNDGRTFVYHGSASGLPPGPSWTVEGFQVDAWFGISVGTAGDLNGDGFSEVIVGAYQFDNGATDEGRVYVYYGNEAGRTSLRRQQRTDGVTPIAPLGNSDSATKFLIRAVMLSVYGRTRLQMEHEVKPYGTLFDGQNTVLGGFVDTGNDGMIEFDRMIDALTPATLYHWRVRAKYDVVKTPFQRNGPWIQIPIQGWNEADLRTAGAVVAVEAPIPEGYPVPGGFELLAVGPNPARGQCRVLLVLPHPGAVNAEVLDVAGRRVAVLAEDESYEAGSHVLTWDGRDRAGAEVSAGVYFVRARVGGETRAWKAVLAR